MNDSVSGTRFSSLCLSVTCLWHGNRHPNYWFTNDSMWVKRAVRILWRKNPCWLFYLQRKSVWTRGLHLSFFPFFLLDVFQQGCSGIHNRFEGIFTTRCYTFVRVKQHSKFPICFIDFIPANKKQSSMSVERSAPTLCPLHFSCLDNRTPRAASISEIIMVVVVV